MEEAPDVSPRVGVHRPIDNVEVGLVRLHRGPAAHRAGPLPPVLREQQVSLASMISIRHLLMFETPFQETVFPLQQLLGRSVQL